MYVKSSSIQLTFLNGEIQILRFSEIIALVIFVYIAEFSKLSVGIFWAGSFPHLSVHPDPLVSDPFGPDNDRTT